MKKIIIGILCGLSIVFSAFADETTSSTENKGTTVKITEQVPGADCKEKEFYDDGSVKYYECSIDNQFSAAIMTLGGMIKYATFISILVGVLFLVLNGILLSISGIDASLKETAKGRITKTILGLVLLLLSGVILNIIAPWIYVL